MIQASPRQHLPQRNLPPPPEGHYALSLAPTASLAIRITTPAPPLPPRFRSGRTRRGGFPAPVRHGGLSGAHTGPTRPAPPSPAQYLRLPLHHLLRLHGCKRERRSMHGHPGRQHTRAGGSHRAAAAPTQHGPVPPAPPGPAPARRSSFRPHGNCRAATPRMRKAQPRPPPAGAARGAALGGVRSPHSPP